MQLDKLRINNNIYNNGYTKELGNLVNLQILSINGNEIKEIPKELNNLVNIKYFSL